MRLIQLGFPLLVPAAGRVFLRQDTAASSAPEQTCNLTVYTARVGDGPPGQFVLPPHKVGTIEEKQCIFKGETYKEGNVKFECKENGWDLLGNTCKGKAQVSEQCGQTTHTFTLHGRSGNFVLPLANHGAAQEAPCVFHDEHYLQGTVRFVCTGGKWQQESHSCSQPASGRCPATDFAFELGSHKASFSLPAGDNADTRLEACEFPEKKYARGALKFVCQAGDWKYAENTCSDKPAGGCAAMEYEVTLEKHAGAFQLPDIRNGEKNERPCTFKDKRYDAGVVKFACSGGKWKYTGNNCADNA